MVTHHAVAQLLLDFEGQLGMTRIFRAFEDLGHGIARKFHVHHGADDLNNFSVAHVKHFLNQF